MAGLVTIHFSVVLEAMPGCLEKVRGRMNFGEYSFVSGWVVSIKQFNIVADYRVAF